MTAAAAVPSYDSIQSSLRKLDELREALRRVRDAAAASQEFLKLPPNWDGEGAVAISEATWQRAADFVLRISTELCDRFQAPPSVPDISPVPDGSVDLDWRFNGHELIVNVPAEAKATAGYYGDDGTGERSIKGKLDPNAVNQWLLFWLTE